MRLQGPLAGRCHAPAWSERAARPRRRRSCPPTTQSGRHTCGGEGRQCREVMQGTQQRQRHVGRTSHMPARPGEGWVGGSPAHAPSSPPSIGPPSLQVSPAPPSQVVGRVELLKVVLVALQVVVHQVLDALHVLGCGGGEGSGVCVGWVGGWVGLGEGTRHRELTRLRAGTTVAIPPHANDAGQQ